MTEVEKKSVWIPFILHKELKQRSLDNQSSIEEEIEKILEKEFHSKED